MLPKCFLKWSRIYLKWRFLSCNKSISSWSYKSGIRFSRRHDFGESPVKDISHGRRKPGAGNFEILVILTFKYSENLFFLASFSSFIVIPFSLYIASCYKCRLLVYWKLLSYPFTSSIHFYHYIVFALAVTIMIYVSVLKASSFICMITCHMTH